MATSFVKNGCRFWMESCYKCGTPFAMSDEVYRTAQQRCDDMEFFCPNGHGQVYIRGESQEQKLRRERDRLKQNQAYLEDQLKAEQEGREHAERSAAARKGQITKMRKRASAGLCPCCNRSFTNLRQHMQTQHPKYWKEEVD